MSHGYRLRDDGVPGFKKIMRGKMWIGRICRHADGAYLGVIGNAQIRAATEEDAFEGIVARELGFQNAGQLKAHSRAAPGITRTEYEFKRNGGKRKGKMARKHAQRQGTLFQDNTNFEPLEVISGLPTRKKVNPNDEAR